jgi:toxin YoeB
MYEVLFTSQAQRDVKQLSKSYLKGKCAELLGIIALDPYSTPPFYEKLVGDLEGYYSRRINDQHRLVYKVLEDLKIIKIHRMWSHYG